MNILNYLKHVNPETTDKNIYNEALKAGACEFIYSISQSKDLFELYTSENGFVYHRPKNETQGGIQSRCTFGVPAVLAKKPKIKKKEERKRKDKKLIYPEIFDFCINGGNLRAILFAVLKKFLKTWIYICSWIEGKYRAFLSNAKGTPAYCKVKYWQIHDFCKAADEYYIKKYFLTLTMAQKQYGTDLETAWKVFNEELAKFNKAFQGTFKGDYACALEAHKSGFPHAHIVLYTNADIEDPSERYDRFKKTVCLCSGKMFEWVNKQWKLGINVLKVNHRKNTCDYLAKYISKATQADLRNYTLRDLNDSSILKEVATMLLPMVFGIREFKLSQGRFNKKQSAEMKAESEFSSVEQKATETKNADDFEIKGSELEEFRTLLKTLCTKLPISCQKKCYQKSFLDFQQLKPLNPEDLERLPIHRNIQIAESGKKLSCDGCVFSKVLDFICNGDTELFDISRNWDLIGSIISFHKKRNNDKSNGAYGGGKKELRKEYLELEAGRDRFFLFPSKEQFYSYAQKKWWTLYKKNFSFSEFKDFFVAAYTVNPMIARFVLPKKWAEIIEYENLHKNNYVSELSREEKQYLKEMCSQIHLELTHSASGLIITENE